MSRELIERIAEQYASPQFAARQRLVRASMKTTGYFRDDYTEGRRCAGPGCRTEMYVHDYKSRGTRARVFCSDRCQEAKRFMSSDLNEQAKAIQAEAASILDAVSEKNPLTDEQRARLETLDAEFRQQLDPAARLAALRQQLGR